MNSRIIKYEELTFKKNQLYFAIIGIIAIATIFIKFASNISPFDAIYDKDIWFLAIPFFLPVVIGFASLRWIFVNDLSTVEKILAYTISTVLTGFIFFIYVYFMNWPNEVKDLVSYILPYVVYTFGIASFVFLRKNPYSTIMLMQIAYISNTLFCFVVFFDLLQTGAYLTLLTSFIYAVQIFSNLKRYIRLKQ